MKEKTLKNPTGELIPDTNWYAIWSPYRNGVSLQYDEQFKYQYIKGEEGNEADEFLDMMGIEDFSPKYLKGTGKYLEDVWDLVNEGNLVTEALILQKAFGKLDWPNDWYSNKEKYAAKVKAAAKKFKDYSGYSLEDMDDYITECPDVNHNNIDKQIHNVYEFVLAAFGIPKRKWKKLTKHTV